MIHGLLTFFIFHINKNWPSGYTNIKINGTLIILLDIHNAMQKSVFAFQAAVHKQTNAVQHLSASSRTALNFLVPKSFPRLSGVLK